MQSENRDFIKQLAARIELERYGHLDHGCQMSWLVGIVFKRVIDYAEAHSNEFFPENLLNDAANFIEELRGELNPLNTTPSHPEPNWKRLYVDGTPSYVDRLFSWENTTFENREEWLWRNIEWLLNDAFEKGTDSKYYWYVGDLSDICMEYLKRPWVQCKAVDHLLIQAMIYQTLLNVGEGIKPILLRLKKDRILGMDIGYRRNKRTYSSALLKPVLIDTAVSIARFLIGGVVGFGVATTHGLGAGVFAGLVVWILLRAYAALTNRKLSEDERLLQLYQYTREAYALINQYPLSPVYLRERLIATVDKGVHLPIGIFAILDSAIAREPLTWATEDCFRVKFC